MEVTNRRIFVFSLSAAIGLNFSAFAEENIIDYTDPKTNVLSRIKCKGCSRLGVYSYLIRKDSEEERILHKIRKIGSEPIDYCVSEVENGKKVWKNRLVGSFTV